MTREQYIEAREGIIEGRVSGNEWEIFYEYWTIHREKEWKEPNIQEFIHHFTIFLNRTFYPSVANIVTEYFDSLYAICHVLDKEGKQLKTY